MYRSLDQLIRLGDETKFKTVHKIFSQRPYYVHVKIGLRVDSIIVSCQKGISFGGT